MDKYKITATHLSEGIGTVKFLVVAGDRYDAFLKWKQVVGNPRQWGVISNEHIAPEEGM